MHREPKSRLEADPAIRLGTKLSKLRILRTWAGRVARRIGVLQVIDNLRFVCVRRVYRQRSRQFISEHPDYPVPPEDIAYDAFGAVDWYEYYKSGPIIAKRFAELMLPHLPNTSLRVCEWGCGPARIIRCMAGQLPEGSKLSGSDYNEKTVQWCRENIPGISFKDNGLRPPLQFDDGAFDAIYAPSVLTHLSEEMCREWMGELTRVCRPGGVILFTTKGDAQKHRLTSAERNKIEKNEPIFRGSIEEGKRMFDTILPSKWVKHELLVDLELLSYEPAAIAESGQDVFVTRKS